MASKHSQIEPTDSTADSALDALELRFAFGGGLGEVLDTFARADAANWKLSWKFRIYYRLRRWIPVVLRQYLQKSRNRSLPVGDAWYVHHDFLEQFKVALGAECRGPAQAIVHPWPDGLEHAVVLTHDIESREGLPQVDKLARLEEQYGLRSAWYFVPAKYRIDSGMLDDLRARGHEVGLHGYNHDGQLFSSKRVFEQRARRINELASDWPATGFRAPMMHRELSWMQALDIDYDASCFDIDPFQAMPGGVGGVWPFIAGRFVELPCTLPQDHTLFVTLQQRTIGIWTKKYALLRALRGMAMCLIHPDYLNTPERWDLYRQLLEQFVAAEGAWKCLPREAASWWRMRDASHVAAAAITGPAAERGRVVDLQSLFAELIGT